MNKIFTDEIIEQICEQYANGEKVSVIAKQFNTSTSYVSRLANQKGLRRKTRVDGVAKVCPKCRKSIPVKGARFCPFCASNIRSSKEVAVEKLYAIRKMVMLLPENCRGEFEEATSIAIKELSK